MSEYGRELTDLIRRLGADAEPVAEGQLAPQWCQVQELGLAGIGIPEEAGGSGGEVADLVVAVRELARMGIATPLVEAATAALAIGTTEPGTFDTVIVDRRPDLNTPTLTAALGVVPFAPLARRIVILGDTGASIATVDAIVEPVLDIAGRPAGRVRVDGVRPVAVDIDPGQVIERLAVLRSAALLGSAMGAYELTRNYVVERRQFGAPLIEIPSVAANLAKMVVRINVTRTALDRAVLMCADRSAAPQRRLGAAAGARIAAAQTATLVATATHQLHGAVGITSEYGLHRYTRALWASRDADCAEQEWSRRLGTLARAGDEVTLWEELTA